MGRTTKTRLLSVTSWSRLSLPGARLSDRTPYGQLPSHAFLARLFCSISSPTSRLPVPRDKVLSSFQPLLLNLYLQSSRRLRNHLLHRLRPMSASTQTTSLLTDSFTAIFSAATSEYQRVTGKSLDSHPLATQFETCNSPEAFSMVLRNQAQAFNKISKGDERLMTWLDPTIQILSIFSATLGDGIGLVRRVTHFLRLFSNTWFSVIRACESNLYGNRYSSRRRSITRCLVRKSL